MINTSIIKSFGLSVFNLLKRILQIFGAILVLAIFFSFTDYPYWAYYRLGTYNTELDGDPNIIILLGGGGMPSPDGLIRSFYAARIGNQYPGSKVIIALPPDTSMHEESPDLLMAHELIIRGIDSLRISFEGEGHNTRAQALNILHMLNDPYSDTLAIRIVTSPEHMYRSVATFRKIGFKNIGGMPSFEEAIPEEMLIRKKIKSYQVAAETRRLGLRYNMWNYLKYEITVIREYCAITYYKFRGWI